MRVHTHCKLKIIPDNFTSDRSIHIKVESKNIQTFLMVVPRKGQFRKTVYAMLDDGEDQKKIVKSASLDEESEIWLVYKPEYLAEGYVRVNSWMTDRPEKESPSSS